MDDVSWPDLTNLEIWPGSEPPKKKKERENTLTKWTFDLNQKVKIFKMDLSHSIFRVHSDFGTRFFIRSSKIVQIVQIPESWLLHKFWPRVKIFKNDLSCPIFHKDYDFGVHFFITRIKLNGSKNINKSQISEALRIQASKAPKNFHHKPSKTKNTRRTRRMWRTKDF